MATDLRQPAAASSDARIPPLEAGDHLTLDEFLRRYEAMPHIHDAELIEGVVHMPSPVTAEDHGEPHFRLITWMGVYEAHSPGVIGGDNSTLRLDVDNAPQPDAYLRLAPEVGGQSQLVGKYVQGPPELIAEVAASSASYDLHEKLNAYRRNGVQEYVVWRVWDQAVDWFVLREGRYVPLRTEDDGVYRSRVFPGLWLDAAAVLAAEMPRVLTVLNGGLASNSHREFVAEMGRRRERA